MYINVHLNVTENRLLQGSLSLILPNKKKIYGKGNPVLIQSATGGTSFIFIDKLSPPNKDLCV